MSEEFYLKNLKKVLARNRNRMMPGLNTEIPVQSLIDSDFCLQVSDYLKESGKWNVLRATPSAGDMLPARSGVYMFFWEPKLRFEAEGVSRDLFWCLYVGKAEQMTLKQRYLGEYKHLVEGDPQILYNENKSLDRKQLLSKYLCLQPLYIWYLCVDDKKVIPDLEDKLIDLLNPPLNSQKSLRGRLLKPQSAF